MTADIKMIAIGGSAGSLQVILKILEYIKPGFPIPVLLILHRNTVFPSPLEELLSLKTDLKVREIEEKDRIATGYIYTCPPDYHVLIEKDHSFSLDDSEKVNYSRPSIDVVFKSASDVYCENLVCILLSGANSDGADGLRYVKKNGGITIIQDPEEAEVPYMPLEAMKRVQATHVLNTSNITGFLDSLIM
jgi:two-component system, chemotaxis family, protein-glutamate methylesterase/glutaminase